MGWRGRTLVNAYDGPRKVPEKLCWVEGLAFERKGNLRAVFSESMNPENEGMDRNYLKSLRREGLNIGILKGENYFTRKTVIRLLDSVFHKFVVIGFYLVL